MRIMKKAPLVAMFLAAMFVVMFTAMPAGLFSVFPGSGAMAEPSPDVLGKGREIFSRCMACHSLERNRIGPKLCGVVGRPVASVPGFGYSAAFNSLEGVWSEEALDTFLSNPRDTVPGTRMVYAGVGDADERLALLAFLKHAAHEPDVCE